MTEQHDPRDVACAREASDQVFGKMSDCLPPTWSPSRALILAAKLAREGWTPTDPLLIEAREIAALVAESRRQYVKAEAYRSGREDNDELLVALLAALKSREGK